MVFNFQKRLNPNEGLFNGHYVDVRSLYVLKFNAIPCVTFIGELDVTKVFSFLQENVSNEATALYQHSFFNHDDREVYFNNTIIVLTFKRMIEIADNYCHVLHTADQYEWARQLVTELAQFRTEANMAYRHTHVVGFAKETGMN